MISITRVTADLPKATWPVMLAISCGVAPASASLRAAAWPNPCAEQWDNPAASFIRDPRLRPQLFLRSAWRRGLKADEQASVVLPYPEVSGGMDATARVHRGTWRGGGVARGSAGATAFLPIVCNFQFGQTQGDAPTARLPTRC